MFIAKIIFISPKYLFWGYSKWQQIKQSTVGLNRGLSWNIWWIRSANHVKFPEVLCVQKSMFQLRYVYKWTEHKFDTMNLTLHEMETHGLSSKEKVANKGGHADSHLGHERTHHYWFPWKGATVNGTSYCQNSFYLLNDPHICWRHLICLLKTFNLFESFYGTFSTF